MDIGQEARGYADGRGWIFVWFGGGASFLEGDSVESTGEEEADSIVLPCAVQKKRM